MDMPTMRLSASTSPCKGADHTAVVSPVLGDYTIEPSGVWYYNGTEWIRDSDPQVIQGGGSALYFTSIANGAGFEELSPVPDFSAVDEEYIALPTANTPVFLNHQYKAAGAIGSANIPAGQWGFRIYAKADNANHETTLQFDVGTIDVLDVVTWHFSVVSPAILTTVLSDYSFVSVQPALVNAATDKIVIRVSGVSEANNTGVTWVHSSAAAYSHISTPPLPILHNELDGINTGDFQHLTAAKVAALDDLIAGSGAVFHHSINFPTSAVQASLVQGTPAWAGTLTAIKATISTVSSASLTFEAFKNGVSIGTVTIIAGNKIATATVSVAALTTDFFGASITASGGDATGAILTFIFTKA